MCVVLEYLYQFKIEMKVKKKKINLQQIFGQLRVASTAFDRKMLSLHWAVLKRRSQRSILDSLGNIQLRNIEE